MQRLPTRVLRRDKTEQLVYLRVQVWGKTGDQADEHNNRTVCGWLREMGSRRRRNR